MTIEVLQEQLLPALNQLQKVLPSKPQLPILSAVLLSTEKNAINFFATDLYIGIQTTVLGKVAQDGTIAIPGKIFRDYISSLPSGKITLSLEETSLTIEANGAKTVMQCISAEEFPAFPDIDGQTFTLSLSKAQDISSMIGFAASIDPTRPVLTSLLLKSSKDGLETVSTDGFRLATLQLPMSAELPSSLLIPAKAFMEVIKIGETAQVEEITCVIAQEMKQVLFTIGNTRLFVRLIEGEYPPYQKIIPPDFTFTTHLDGKELEEQVKRAVIFSRDTANIITFTFSDEDLMISATSPTFGTYQGHMAIKEKTKDVHTIAFNARYVLDFLSALKPNELEFSMNESLTPARFKPTNAQGYAYIVMPFRVNE